MKTSIFLLLALVGSSSCYRLSEEENAELQASCGMRSKKYEHKVLGGVRARAKDFPWAAKVSLDGFLTASVISSRHVILFNLAVEKNDTIYLQEDEPLANSTCDGADLILSEEAGSQIDVNFISYSDGSSPIVERIIVIDGCKRLDTYKPMILELAEELLFDKNHGPICISTSPDLWSAQEELTVYGLSPEARRLTSAKFAPKTCGFRRVPKEVNCARPMNQSQGMCAGDFGGGAVAEIDGKATLLGVFAEGNTRCSKSPEKHRIPEFINIGYYSDAICERVGICAGPTTANTTSSEEEAELPQVPEQVEEGSGASPTSTTEQAAETTTTTSTDEVDLLTTSSAPGDSIQSLIAETFEKLKLNGSLCSKSKDQDSESASGDVDVAVDGEEDEVHIHIHLHSDSDSRVV